METFNYRDPAMEKAFENTYRLVTGELEILDLVASQPDMTLLYDPSVVDDDKVISVLENLMDYYIDLEEYDRCAKLRDLAKTKTSRKKLFNNLQLPEKALFPPEEFTPDPLTDMIQSIKKLSRETFRNGFIDFMKNISPDEVTNSEIWSILTIEDKDIFSNMFSKFDEWMLSLSEITRDIYIDRLMDGKSLIPEELDMTMREEFLPEDMDIEYEEEEDDIEVNYNANVIVSFMDNYTIMSHTNLDKLKSIRSSLIFHGILDIELREKEIPEGTLYSLVYNSSQKPTRPNWN